MDFSVTQPDENKFGCVCDASTYYCVLANGESIIARRFPTTREAIRVFSQQYRNVQNIYHYYGGRWFVCYRSKDERERITS